jgi:tetratricopeptide (TPR) repeat protein/GTPase SAR1 family protein
MKTQEESGISVDELLEKARSAQYSYRNDEALKCYDQLLGLDLDTDTVLYVYCKKIQILRLVGRFEEAVEIADRGISIAVDKNSPNRQKEGRLRMELGITYHRSGQFDKADEANREAVGILYEVKDMKSLAMALNSMGNFYNYKRDFRTSLLCYQKSLQIAEEMADNYILSFPLCNVGNTYFNIQEYSKAMEILNKAAGVCEEVNDKTGIAYCQEKLGDIYHIHRADYDRSMEYYNQSLEIAEEIGDRISYLSALSSIALLYYSMEEYDKSLSYCEKTLKEGKAMDDLFTVAGTYFTMGSVHYGKKEIDKATEYTLKAVEVCRELGAMAKVGDYIFLLAWMYENSNKPELAMKYYKESLETREHLGNKRDIYELLSKIAYYYDDEDDGETALTFFKRILSLYSGSDDGEYMQLIRTYPFLSPSNTSREKSEYMTELEELKGVMRDKRISDQSNNLSNAIGRIASILNSNGEYEEAVKYYLDELHMHESAGRREDVGDVIDKIVELYRENGRYKEAVEFLETFIDKLIAGDNKREVARLLIKIASIYQEDNDFDNAMEYCKIFIARLKEENQQEGLTSYLTDPALHYIEKGDCANAVEYCMNLMTSASDHALQEKSRIIATFETKGYKIIINPVSSFASFFFIALSHSRISLVIVDDEPGDWLADEERFNDEEPLWFSESSHRVSPVWKMKQLMMAVDVFLAEFCREFQLKPDFVAVDNMVIITGGTVINVEDMKDEWDQLNVKVVRSASGRPEELPFFDSLLPKERLSPPVDHFFRFTEKMKDYFSNIPGRVLSQDRESFRTFLAELRNEEKDYLCEIKLILVGEERAGKTSLTEALSIPDYRFEPGKTSTRGINVMEWDIPKEEFLSPRQLRGKKDDAISDYILGKSTPNDPAAGDSETDTQNVIKKDFKINIWDFGGQEIYHSTHQFFLTEHSVYFLVTEARKDVRHEDFYYWLNIIEILGGQSPVVLVLNKRDQPTTGLPVQEYREVFNNIVDYEKVSCKPDFRYSIENLKETLKRIIKNKNLLPEIGTPLPKVWIDIRREIEGLKQSGKNYISYNDYVGICKRYFSKDVEENAIALSKYFHNLGVFTHFRDDFQLNKTLFLNHRFITEAVYNVLDNQKVIDNQGIFDERDLEKIWHDKEFRDMQRELLAVMKNKKFDICYEVEPGKYHAPHLLPHNKPPHLDLMGFENPRSLTAPVCVEYCYKFMPKGILTRLIVKRNRDVYRNTYWRYGVLLEYANTHALLQEKYFERKISIILAGENKAFLLEEIHKTFREIHANFQNIVVRRMIACNCPRCRESDDPQFYEVAVLERRRRETPKKTVECHKSYNDIKIDSLLADVISHGKKGRTEEERITPHIVPSGESGGKRLFISYSHSDDHWLKRLKVYLKPLERYCNIDIWDDTQVKVGDRWKKEIESALTAADMAILLISADFMASDFITRYELPALLKKASDEGTRILPILVEPSLFDVDEQLSQFQAVNPPEMTLSLLPEAQQGMIMVKLARQLLELLKR